MKEILIEQTAGEACCVYTAIADGSKVTIGAPVWGEVTPQDPTDSVTISAVNGPSITMNGAAWRELEDNSLVEGFIRLLILSELRAAKLVSLAESGATCYRGLATRDSGTESCTTYATTDDENDHLRDADDEAGYVVWSANDNPTDSAYFGSGSDDIEEIDIADALNGLLRDAIEEATRDAATKSLSMVRLIARLLIPSDTHEDGTPVDSATFGADASETLARLVKECRGVIQAAEVR